MKSLFEPATTEEVKQRMAHLCPQSERQWGKMAPAQALAHCSATIEVSVGLKFPPRNFLGRLIGRHVLNTFLAGKPFPHNSPTDKIYVVKDERDFAAERQRLLELIDRFVGAGRGEGSKHVHSFFGPMTSHEWAELNYLHLDHHLRQFGV
jgi:hypothetical protein